jgi:catechol 2,3-dioxygenase-like lactoylglutathione lyase family enzyme
MELYIAQMLQKFEAGKVSRRKLIETIAVAATAVYGGKVVDAVEAAPAGRGSFKTQLVNHISYGCPDYRKPRDFYTDLMGMELVDKSDNGQQAILAFGPKGSTPLNSPYGTPVSHLIVRNGKGVQGVAGAPPVKAVVNHIAYTIANWDQKKVLEELKKRDLNPREDTANSYHVYDPNGYDLQISGIKMSAFGSGG